MSGLPAGFRPAPNALPKGFRAAPDDALPNGFRDAPAAIGNLDTQIDSAASSNGIDPHVFRSLISHESSFDPRAVSSAGAQGLGQLMPGTAKEMGVTDAFDPQQNLNGSAKYLGSLVKRYHGDYDRAVAAYNAGPGNVDKLGLNALRVPGADPNYVSKIMGSLNAPIVAPAEAASTSTALPQGFRAVNAANPAPQIKPPPVKPPPTNAPPTASHVERTPIEQFGGALTAATQSLPGAIAENRLGDFIGMVKKSDFAGAKDEFGFLSKPMLERGAKSGNPFARYALDHPAGTAAAQFAADWSDPALNLAGKGIAKAAGEGAKLIAATPEGRLLMNAFSPFKSIAAGAGDAGKRAMQGMMVRLASMPAEAQKAALRIFGGLSDAEQHDVVHIHQDKPSYIRTTDLKRLDTLKQRAATLSTYVTQLSDAQVGAGRLQATTAAARDKYFPLSDYFTPIRTDAQKAKFIEDLTSSGGSGSMSRATSEAKQAEHTSLAQAEHRVANDPNFHATKNPDWSPVQALEDWAARRSKNIEFDDSLKGMPKELRRDMTPADYRLPNGQPLSAWKSSAYDTDAETLAKIQRDHPSLHIARESPKDLRGRSMLAFDELPHNVQEQLANSPVMKTSWVSQDFAKYLAGNATRLFKEPTIETGNKLLDGTLKTWDGFNNATRAAIIANPLYHPLFNLSNNTLGAGLPLHQVASLVTKNVINTFGGGKLIDAFEKRVGQDYSKGLEDAMRAGALAEMKIGGKDATRRLAARFQDLSTGDKIGKLGDTVQAWNSRLTFGTRGEEAFSNALYAHLMKSGNYQPEEAGGLVREALGNYQNVSPQAWQNRVFFFYPWLKGNMAFWARKAATNPKAVYAPADAARRNNQLVADPNERKPTGRAKDFQFTFGNAKDGFGRGTLPLPQRMVTDVDEMTSGDPARVGKSALNVGSSRLVPGLKALYDSAVTIAQPAKDPRLPQNFNTVFDKDAARGRQYQQIGTYAAGMLPVPVVGFEAKDALREGGVKDPRMSATAALTSTGLHADSRDADYKQINGIRRQLETSLSRAKNVADPDRRAVVVKQAQDVYERRIARFLPGQSRAPITPPPINALPTGFRAVDAPLPQGFRPVQ